MSGKPHQAPEAKPDKLAATATTSKVGAPAPALPDAALMDDGVEAAPALARTGAAAWMPHSVRGWAIAGSAAVSLVIIASAAVVSLTRTPAQASPTTVTLTGTATVIDGATISVAGRKLLLGGIEAPPANLICRDRAWKYRCGDDSRRGLENIIGRGSLECVVGPTDEATCRNDQGMDVAAWQVENGWAVVDLHHSSRYFVEQARAQEEGRGLWRNDFGQKETWRLDPGDDKK